MKNLVTFGMGVKTEGPHHWPVLGRGGPCHWSRAGLVLVLSDS